MYFVTDELQIFLQVRLRQSRGSNDNWDNVHRLGVIGVCHVIFEILVFNHLFPSPVFSFQSRFVNKRQWCTLFYRVFLVKTISGLTALSVACLDASTKVSYVILTFSFSKRGWGLCFQGTSGVWKSYSWQSLWWVTCRRCNASSCTFPLPAVLDRRRGDG